MKIIASAFSDEKHVSPRHFSALLVGFDGLNERFPVHFLPPSKMRYSIKVFDA
ncbi:hypothetical protein [Xanthomonas graminis]|uniref:hypothetical protein n=1 Tax=Xanthomonas graminis TaxID=3390026 RepID=UPI0012DA1943|nr:hypothetical protein [Xanthomonas translucens]UKE77322.1 hypothetical protein KM317_18225 [Xanthomonas translucens pv. arrhenatheri]